jgi:crotonobetainyl-CoA:carnitine CoA-transferase CaiB-like acyl-CoA transferase
MSINRNKKSIVLDFGNADDLEVAKDLVRRADICLENFKVGGLKKFGLDYESVRMDNPGLIYLSISGFGTKEGAWLPGYDLIGLRSSGDKVTRARPFSAAVANGNVRLVRGPWITDWLDEFASFPEACNHDDQVDSAVGAFTYLAGLGLPQRKRAAIII